MKAIRYKLESLRQRMHIAALQKGISHPDVLVVSQRMDKALNEFYKLDQGKAVDK